MAKSSVLGDNISTVPAAFDVDAAKRLCERLGPRFFELSKDAQALVSGVAGCSPYLARLMQRAPERLGDILGKSPEAALQSACETARRAGAAESKDDQMRGLRRAKDEAALAIALADIAGAWNEMEAARAMSDFADAAVGAALNAAANAEGGPIDAISIIAMGKHGAQELNYSSDIDLIVLYDRQALEHFAVDGCGADAVKMTRAMVGLLQTQTADGYVFRTDLRLRPDPGVTPVAITFAAAEVYYESFGQNWERMAFIKARAAAGDFAMGESFLKTLRPFVWRKFLDFATIEDVHAVKRQIQSAKGGARIEFEGHDIKLGRGGIREIEFFVQTQQLILGGKNPNLRRRGTIDALAALEAAGRIAQDQRAALEAAYRYLRRVEHRLQMINDEQTQRIPKASRDIERLAMFLGEDSAEAFREKLQSTLDEVRRRYDKLFAADEPAAAPVGRLVFTGVESDPDTIETLQGLGFRRAEDVAAKIRLWHAGGVRATKTTRARLLLTKLVPHLLEALSKAGDPDAAFFAFAAFLERLPAGVQVFSLLAANIGLFDTLIRIMTISPFLGRELSRRVNFVEDLVQKGAAALLPPPSSYGALLEAFAQGAETYEQTLNLVRRWAGEQQFRVAVKLADDAIDGATAAAHFTAIAEPCVRALAPATIEEMRRQYGMIKGDLAVVALGRLGAAEMTASSDIDLMFIYDAPSDAQSDGARALTPTEYFTRLVRRIVTALSAATEEGGLYDVDMQLRPSGGSGPLAVSFSAFRHYYEQEAWTWEVMALSKARAIAGSPRFCASVDGEIDAILRRPRSRAKVAGDVNDMRRRLLQAKPGAGVWDVKHVLGGLTDIAFICQCLGLVVAEKRGRPPLATGAAIGWLAETGDLGKDDATTLAQAYAMFEAVLHAGRAAVGGVFKAESAGETLRERMVSLCGAPTIEDAEKALTLRQSQVAKIYRKVIGQGPDTGDGRK